MLFTEFDQEQYDNHRRKEGYQDGHKDGEKDALIRIVKRMKAKGMSLTEITELTGLSEEQIEEIKEV